MSNLWRAAVLVCLLQPLNAKQLDTRACQKVAKQIKHLESKMRRGYTVKKGEQLKKRMRQLKKQRYACHKSRLPTK